MIRQSFARPLRHVPCIILPTKAPRSRAFTLSAKVTQWNDEKAGVVSSLVQRMIHVRIEPDSVSVHRQRLDPLSQRSET